MNQKEEHFSQGAHLAHRYSAIQASGTWWQALDPSSWLLLQMLQQICTSATQKGTSALTIAIASSIQTGGNYNFEVRNVVITKALWVSRVSFNEELSKVYSITSCSKPILKGRNELHLPATPGWLGWLCQANWPCGFSRTRLWGRRFMWKLSFLRLLRMVPFGYLAKNNRSN